MYLQLLVSVEFWKGSSYPIKAFSDLYLCNVSLSSFTSFREAKLPNNGRHKNPRYGTGM
jgi:hypothetical protein